MKNLLVIAFLGIVSQITAQVQLSDARFKHNIVVVPHGLASILKLNPKKYVFNYLGKERKMVVDSLALSTVVDTAVRGRLSRRLIEINKNNQTQLGLIAQEVLPIIPEIVEGDAINGYGINYGSLTAPLIRAVQDQQVLIDRTKQVTNTTGSIAMLTASQYIVICNNAATNITVPLPAPATSKGLDFIIKRGENSTGTVTISCSLGVINALGAVPTNTTVLSARGNYGHVMRLFCDGTKWQMIN